MNTNEKPTTDNDWATLRKNGNYIINTASLGIEGKPLEEIKIVSFSKSGKYVRVVITNQEQNHIWLYTKSLEKAILDVP